MVKSEVGHHIATVQVGDLIITTLNTIVLVTAVSKECYAGVVVAEINNSATIGTYSEGWVKRNCSKFYGSVSLSTS